jgi:hypothetical protein
MAARGLLIVVAFLCTTVVSVSPAYAWSPQPVPDNFAAADPYQLDIVDRGRDFLRYDRKGDLYGRALNELVHAYADLYVASKRQNRATIKLVNDIFDPVSAFPLCPEVRLTKWLRRLIAIYSAAQTTIDAVGLVNLDNRIKQDLRYIDYLWYWIDRYDLRTGRFIDKQNPNNRAHKAVQGYFQQLRREVEAAQKNPRLRHPLGLRGQAEPDGCSAAGSEAEVSVRLFVRGPGRAPLGTVTATGQGLSVTVDRSETQLITLPVGTTITITATPGPPNIFAGWHAARCGWPYENTEVPGVHGGRQASWTCTITAPDPPVPGQGHGPFVIVGDAFFCDPENTPAGLCESLPRARPG